jgi:hypothetical protein
MTLQWVAALLAPAICNFGPPYGFFVGQHIVAVTAAEGGEETDIKRRGARHGRCRVIGSIRKNQRVVTSAFCFYGSSLGDHLGD